MAKLRAMDSPWGGSGSTGADVGGGFPDLTFFDFPSIGDLVGGGSGVTVTTKPPPTPASGGGPKAPQWGGAPFTFAAGVVPQPVRVGGGSDAVSQAEVEAARASPQMQAVIDKLLRRIPDPTLREKAAQLFLKIAPRIAALQPAIRAAVLAQMAITAAYQTEQAFATQITDALRWGEAEQLAAADAQARADYIPPLRVPEPDLPIWVTSPDLVIPGIPTVTGPRAAPAPSPAGSPAPLPPPTGTIGSSVPVGATIPTTIPTPTGPSPVGGPTGPLGLPVDWKKMVLQSGIDWVKGKFQQQAQMALAQLQAQGQQQLISALLSRQSQPALAPQTSGMPFAFASGAPAPMPSSKSSPATSSSTRTTCECTGNRAPKRAKGECGQGYFREIPGRDATEFTYWSHRKCP